MQPLSIAKIVIRETLTSKTFQREPEPDLVMTDGESVAEFDEATASGGPLDGVHAFILLHASSVLNGAKTVIDMGCGSGQLLLKIAQLHPNISFTGLDLSESMLERAEKNRIALGIQNVKFVSQNICDLKDFGSKSQDAVISSLAMHHLPDLDHLEQMLSEVKRVVTASQRVFLFDHGRLKALKSVADVLSQYQFLSPSLFKDFEASLKASFSPREIGQASLKIFGNDLELYHLVLSPLYLMLVSKERSLAPEVKCSWNLIFNRLSPSKKSDFRNISLFFRLNGLASPK